MSLEVRGAPPERDTKENDHGGENGDPTQWREERLRDCHQWNTGEKNNGKLQRRNE
jgi:hypothetical protein